MSQLSIVSPTLSSSIARFAWHRHESMPDLYVEFTDGRLVRFDYIPIQVVDLLASERDDEDFDALFDRQVGHRGFVLIEEFPSPVNWEATKGEIGYTGDLLARA